MANSRQTNLIQNDTGGKKFVQRLERSVGNWERVCEIILNNEILCFLKASLKEVNALFNLK